MKMPVSSGTDSFTSGPEHAPANNGGEQVGDVGVGVVEVGNGGKRKAEEEDVVLLKKARGEEGSVEEPLLAAAPSMEVAPSPDFVHSPPTPGSPTDGQPLFSALDTSTLNGTGEMVLGKRLSVPLVYYTSDSASEADTEVENTPTQLQVAHVLEGVGGEGRNGGGEEGVGVSVVGEAHQVGDGPAGKEDARHGGAGDVVMEEVMETRERVEVFNTVETNGVAQQEAHAQETQGQGTLMNDTVAQNESEEAKDETGQEILGMEATNTITMATVVGVRVDGDDRGAAVSGGDVLVGDGANRLVTEVQVESGGMERIEQGGGEVQEDNTIVQEKKEEEGVEHGKEVTKENIENKYGGGEKEGETQSVAQSEKEEGELDRESTRLEEGEVMDSASVDWRRTNTDDYEGDEYGLAGSETDQRSEFGAPPSVQSYDSVAAQMPDSASEATGLGEEDQRDRMDMEDGQEGGSMGENPDQSPATPLSPVMQGPNYESLYGMGAASVFGGDVQNQMFESETSPREDWGGNGGQGQGDGGTPKVRSPDGNVQCGQRAEENRYRSWSGPDMRSAHKGDANNSPMRVMGWSPRSGVISPGPPAAYGQISPYYSVVQSPASMANTPGSRIDLLDVSTPGSLASPNPYLTPGAFQPTTPAALQPCDFGRHRHPLPPIPLEVPISEITPVMLDPMVVFSLRGEAQYSGVCPSRHVKGISPRPRAAIRNANCYTKDRMVGKGTFGEVFKGKDPTSGRLVALKKVLLPPDNELDGIPVTTIRELRFMSLVNHPNVLHLDEVCSTNPSSDGKLGHIYLVFEWMHHDLKGLIERHEVPMPPSQVKHYMRQLLEGLRFLHLHNIMHRDLKSSNVLVNNDGVLKIADFGLACKVDEVHEDKNMTFRAVTLWYRPPELLLEQARYDTQCDMWSAGCILGELLERTAILMGTTEIDQLDKIWQLCGTPNPHYWPYYGEYLSRRGVTFPHYERQVANRFRRKYEECPPLVNLLEALLQTNPDRRLSAEASLDHDAFWTDPMPRDNIAELRLEESHEMNVVGMIKRRMRASMSQQPMPNPRSGPHPSHHRGPMPQQGPPFHQNSHRPHPYNQNQQQHLGVRPHGARPPGPDQRGMHGRDSRGGSSHHGDWRGGGPKGPRPGNFHPGQPGPGHAGGQQHHNRSGSPHRQKPPPGQHPNQQQGPPNPQQGGPNPNFNRHRNNQPARPSNLGPPGSFQSRAPNPNHPPNQNMMNMPPRPGGGHMPAANPNAPRPPHPHAPRPPGHQGRPGDQQRRHSQGQGPPGGPGADQRRGSGGPQDFQRYNQQRQPDRYPNAPPNQGPPGQVQRKPPQQGMPQTYHQGGQFPNQQTFRQQPPQPGQPQHHRHPQHGQQPPVPGRDRRDSGNWGGGGAPPGAGGHRPQVPPAGQRPPGHGHPPQGGNPQGGPKPFGGGPAAGGGQGGTGQNYQQNQWKK